MKHRYYIRLWLAVLVGLAMPFAAGIVGFGGGPGWLAEALTWGSVGLLVVAVWWAFGKVNSPKP